MIERTVAGSPDLFVVCKNCGSEVSPYITECPYCGQRLRKRAPKIERDGAEGARPRARRVPRPSLGPLRSGEIPGIAGDHTRRPVVTIALVVLSVFGYLVLAFLDRGDLGLVGPINGDWWRVFTTPFVYANPWYQLVAVVSIGIFGWSLEKRHGPVIVAFLFLLTGVAPMALVAAVESFPIALGANGAGLGFLAAWAVPHLLARRAGHDPDDDDADLLGAWTLAILLAVMPIATPDADVLAGAAGLVGGALMGLLLAKLRPRR
jgi:membrane associated rhomboid family serine protease